MQILPGPAPSGYEKLESSTSIQYLQLTVTAERQTESEEYSENAAR